MSDDHEAERRSQLAYGRALAGQGAPKPPGGRRPGGKRSGGNRSGGRRRTRSVALPDALWRRMAKAAAAEGKRAEDFALAAIQASLRASEARDP